MSFFNLFKKKHEEKVDANEFNHELNDGLAKTRRGFMERVMDVFTGKQIDDDLYEELEEILISGDIGVETSINLVEALREREIKDKLKTSDELQEAFVEELNDRLGGEKTQLNLTDDGLNIILVVGVNGVGKTTSIGKLAYRLKNEGYDVLLGAADTFRAGATEQLKVWGERVGVDVISHQEGADPSAVVYDAIKAAQSRKTDVLLIDTAGRLHNKVNLMQELSKMRRVIDREAPGALREVLLVLDATTGQNALSQAKTFSEATGVTGVILTKLDGTAKGGVVIGVNHEYGLPVKFIGVGEGIDHLQPFDPEAFAQALFKDILEEKQAEKDAENISDEATEEGSNQDA